MEQRPHDSKNSPGATGPAASAADPVTATPARRHRRRPAHATPSPVPPTSASPTNASPTTDEAPGATASAPAEPAAPAARGTRRRARATTPRLVAPPRAEPTESVPEVASAPESAQSEAAPPEHAAIALPPAAGDHLSPAEPAVLVGVAPVGAAAPALEPVPAPAPAPARRYRFDRPAAHTGTPSRVPARPERLSVVSPAPIGTNGAPERSLAATESATGPAEESGGDLADSAPEVATAPLGGEAPGLTETPADHDLLVVVTADTDGPTRIESLAASEVGDGQEPGHESAEVDAAGADHVANGEELGEVTSTGRRRRRRRRGNGSAAGIRHLDAILADEHDEAEQEPPPTRNGGRGSAAAHEPPEPEETSPTDLFGHTGPVRVSPRAASAAHSASPPDQPYELYGPYQPEPWSIANSYQQIGLDQSPFGAPEPNTARGFGPQPHGVAGPAPDRPERVGRGTRGERATDLPPMSANQLSATVTHAIQQQTDRLLTELRHTPASPAMTVTFPPLPSTERVGVFVDVANLLYSSRSLRVGLDFGRLLEFLRGGRRLIRAQAYAPTNPEPRAEQQFLAVVKGVGYRITTKNYKTFSSGAKKADLDLDLCMDIVRLVEARALDTVVLVSGDSDFLPLLEYCSDHGVRVEVAAFEDAAAAILRQSCDLFINLSLVEDIRA